tara:strand:- start:1084 stop:2979 length:1896 start_codon:yes stop_codon:yes gene_type:complete
MGLFSTPQTQSVDPVELARQQVRVREQENLIGRASLNPTQTIGLLYSQAGRSLGRAIEKLSGYEDPLITQAKKQKQMDGMLAENDATIYKLALERNIPIGTTPFYQLAYETRQSQNLPSRDVLKSYMERMGEITQRDQFIANQRDSKARNDFLQNIDQLSQPPEESYSAVQAPEISSESKRKEFELALGRPVSTIEKKKGRTLTYNEYQALSPAQKEVFEEDVTNEGILKMIEANTAGTSESVAIPIDAYGSPVAIQNQNDLTDDRYLDQTELNLTVAPINKKIKRQQTRIDNIKRIPLPEGAGEQTRDARRSAIEKEEEVLAALQEQKENKLKLIVDAKKARKVTTIQGQAFMFDPIANTYTKLGDFSTEELIPGTAIKARRGQDGKMRFFRLEYDKAKTNASGGRLIIEKEIPSSEVDKIIKDNVQTSTNAVQDAFLGKLEPLITERYKEYEDYSKGLRAVNFAQKMLDDGFITGTGAELKTNILSFAKSLGLPLGKDTIKVISNQQTYQAVLGYVVGEVIKQFGAGTGLSDNDAKIAARIAGQDVTAARQTLMDTLAVSRAEFRGGMNRRQPLVDYIQTNKQPTSGELMKLLYTNINVPVYVPPTVDDNYLKEQGGLETDYEITINPK